MLQINGLSIGHSHAGKLALQQFSLAAGEQCLLTGKSGTGKTTLLLTCAGLMRPLAGEVSVNGQNIQAMSESKRDLFRGANIGLVFQTLHLMPLLSVEDNLKLVFYAAGLPIHNERMNHVLERLGLEALRRRLPHTLSQGQAQRLCIARAVVHLPKLILADEPTSSLDDDNCKTVMLLLQELAREANAALLVSTHDSRIKEYFSRITSLEELRA